MIDTKFYEIIKNTDRKHIFVDLNIPLHVRLTKVHIFSFHNILHIIQFIKYFNISEFHQLVWEC